MSDPAKRQMLREALEQAGSGWLLAYWGAEAERMLEKVGGDIDQFATEYARRFRESPDPFALLQSDPYKGRAFFQVDTLTLSVEMKIMVWRILLGCEIARIEFHYELGQTVKLGVTLRTPYGEEEQYRAAHYHDFRVLRHFGASGTGDRLILQGYYAHK